MAKYDVSFELNSEKHFTNGEINYPTKENYVSKNYSEEISKDWAFVFIDNYVDTKKIDKKIHPLNVSFTIHF